MTKHHIFEIISIILEMDDFNVILRMDWLDQHDAIIDYYHKWVISMKPLSMSIIIPIRRENRYSIII